MLVFAVSVVLLLAVHVRFGAGFQETASDFLFVTRIGHPAISTVIVGIDERSHHMLIARHGAMSQWPRTLYARAIDSLVAAGARVIGLAVFFEGARPEDGELGEAMRRAGNVVIPVLAQGPLEFDPAPGVASVFRSSSAPSARYDVPQRGKGWPTSRSRGTASSAGYRCCCDPATKSCRPCP